MAADVTKPNTFVDGNANTASQVMTDFTTIRDWLNTNAVHLDAAKPMTGALSGPSGVDPVSANEYMRKQYVDNIFATEATARTAGDVSNARRGVGCSVASVSVSPSTQTSMPFDTEIFDTDGFFTPTSTNITVPSGLAGVYLLHVDATGSVTTQIIMEVYKNGVLYSLADLEVLSNITSKGMYVEAFVIPLVVGDVITVKGYHTAGGPMTVSCRVIMVRTTI